MQQLPQLVKHIAAKEDLLGQRHDEDKHDPLANDCRWLNRPNTPKMCGRWVPHQRSRDSGGKHRTEECGDDQANKPCPLPSRSWEPLNIKPCGLRCHSRQQERQAGYDAVVKQLAEGQPISEIGRERNIFG